MTERELRKQRVSIMPFRSRSHSIIFIVYTWTPNITPLTKDHQVWSSISKHMTPNYYSSPQSILGDLTNNMSFSVASSTTESCGSASPTQHNAAEQKVSAFAPLLSNASQQTHSAFWTAYQKSLQDLHQQKPIQLTSSPLDLTNSKW